MKNNTKTYILTGATGFLGCSVAHDLIRKGHNIILFVRSKSGQSAESRTKNLFKFSPTEFEKVTVIDTDLQSIIEICSDFKIKKILDSFNSIDGVLHFAANLSFRSRDRESVYESNLQGTNNVVWLTKEYNSTLYHISTAYVHGRRRGKLLENELVRSKFNNSYEESKFETEVYLRKEINNGLKCVILRPSIIVRDIAPRAAIVAPFGYYSLVYSIYKLHKYLTLFCKKHKVVAMLMGISLNKTKVHSNIIPFFITNTSLNFIPLHVVSGSIIRIIEDGKNIKNGTVFHLVNPKPLSLCEISRTALTGVGFQMRIVTLPAFLVNILYKLLKLLSFIVRPLTDISKKFHYYGYYMTNTYDFDTTNSNKYLHVEDNSIFFRDQVLYLEKATEHFISLLE